VLTLLVGDTAGSYGIRRLVPSLHVYDVFDHAFPSSCVAYWSSLSGLAVLASVTLDSDDISSSHVAVDIVRRLYRLAISRIVLFYLQTFEHYFCVNHQHHRYKHVCTTLF